MYYVRIMDGSASVPVFSDAMLLAACKLSCTVRDEPSYVTTGMGSVEPHVVASTATKNRECQIHDIGCIESMKDGSNNQPASVHEGALSQFLDICSNSPLQEEFLPFPDLLLGNPYNIFP